LTMALHVIVGAGGPVSTFLARALPEHGVRVRLVGRNPKAVIGNEELVRGDVTSPEDMMNVVKGAAVTYIVVGLEYSIKVWRTKWPLLMTNVIAACEAHGSKLVFFDNVYMLGLVRGEMTEDTPMEPCSRKGVVRKQIDQMVLDHIRAGTLQGMIVRAPDFYGPVTPLSFVNLMILEKIVKGSTPLAVGSGEKRHTFAFTPDVGRAVALLGCTEDAFGQIWNVPCPQQSPTQGELVSIAAKAANGPNADTSYSLFRSWYARVLGCMMPTLGEMHEMMYQFEEHFDFSCAKFMNRFPDFRVTSYEDGIRETLESLKKK